MSSADSGAGFITELEVIGDEVSPEALFDWLMLQELRRHVTRLDAKSFAELRSYNQPPQVRISPKKQRLLHKESIEIVI